MGGNAAAKPKIQVIAQPMRAWVPLKEKLPRGLQMTRNRSKATTAKDHKLTIPGWEQSKKREMPSSVQSQKPSLYRAARMENNHISVVLFSLSRNLFLFFNLFTKCTFPNQAVS